LSKTKRVSGANSTRKCEAAVMVLLMTFFANGAAYAQQESEEGPESNPGEEQGRALDAIVVTARKIEEPIQRIPFGISVFTADEIERRDIHDARSFGRSVPGFNFVDTGLRGSNIPNIRGTGSFFPQSADDGSVPVFIDGMPVPLRAQDREFFDVRRIEVLRGPQSTLYGRNAQAGAININTADPAFEPDYELGVEVGNFESRRLTALANQPLSDRVAFRLAAQYDTRDGDVPDLKLGDDARDQDLVNVHAKVLWRPDAATDVTLAIRYGTYDEQPVQGVLVENPEFPQLFLDRALDYDFKTLGVGLTARRDFGRWSLTSVTGYQDYTLDFIADDSDGLVFNALTGLPPSAFNDPDSDFRRIADDGRQFSQEVRVDGELENGVQLVGGLFYFRSELDFGLTFNATGFLNGRFDNDFTTDSYAAFAEATVPLGERLNLIGGLRYTREEREFNGAFRDLSGAGPVTSSMESGDRVFDFVTGRAALTYDIAARVTAYASIARGAKSGGFQLADTDVAFGFQTSQFDEAITTAYEAGVRGGLADGLVDFSLSGFFNDTKDENLQVFDITTFQAVIENADTESYGLEAELTVRPVERLALSGGFAWTETQITASDDPTVTPGNDVPFTPSAAYNLSADYSQPLALFGAAGSAFTRIDYQFVGERTSDPQNRLTLDSFDLVNLRVGWDSDRLSVYAFADNVFEEEYVETSFLFGVAPDGSNVSFGIPGQPRRYGVGTRIRF